MLVLHRWAEWWAHCRPHSSGHQLHFDSDDEGCGGVRNPICSTVLYLSQDCGGPTLVTTQTRQGPMADRGWLVHSKANRLVVFDGSVLHGVIPGNWHGRPLSAAGDEAVNKRVTWMVAFWETTQPHAAVKWTVKVTNSSSHLLPSPFVSQVPAPRSKMPFLPGTMHWQSLVPENAAWEKTAAKEKNPLSKPGMPVFVDTVWEKVRQGGGEEKQQGGKKKKTSSNDEGSVSATVHYDACFQGF